MKPRVLPILETARLRLRPLTLDDAPRLHDLLDRDEAVWRFDPGYARPWEERLVAVRRRLAQYETFGFGCYAAELRTTGELIGQGGLSPYFFEHADGTHSLEFEVMYTLGSAYWGQGFATELSEVWVRYAFREARLRRLVDCPHKANGASVRVLEKLGFRVEDDPLNDAYVIAVLEQPAASSSSLT